MKNNILLIGGGGHCKSIIDTIKTSTNYNIVGIIDKKENIGKKILDIDIIGTDDKLKFFREEGIKYAFLSVGSIGEIKLRYDLYTLAKKLGYEFPNIIDSSSILANDIKLGTGNFIGKGVIINSNVRVLNNCIINTGAILEHDCEIKDFCHIAPGTVISGNVKVGKNSHIGTNATVIQNIRIGDNTIIGAGSVVIKNIDSNKKAYGNPCKEVK